MDAYVCNYVYAWAYVVIDYTTDNIQTVIYLYIHLLVYHQMNGLCNSTYGRKN